MVYGLGYHTLRLKGRGGSRSLGYHALRWMCVKGDTEFQKCGKSHVFLDPDLADLRKGWRRISEMWQIPCVFWTLTPRICVRGVDFEPPLQFRQRAQVRLKILFGPPPPRAVNQLVTVTSNKSTSYSNQQEAEL